MLCYWNVLEGFAEFPRETNVPESLRYWKRGSGVGFFPVSIGFAEFIGLPLFIEHLGATAAVATNTGVTKKQQTITANMVDMTKPMFTFVCITMPTSNIFTSILSLKGQMQTGLEPPDGISYLKTRNK